MDASAASGATAGQDALPADFGAGRLFLADSRLALAVLNYGRHRALNRVFGTSREEANALTFILMMLAADAAYVTARKAVRAPLNVSGADVAMGGFLMREGALGIAGPGVRGVPLLGTLLTVAVFGRVAIPALRQAAHSIRAAERRVRLQRMGQYSAAKRAGAWVASVRGDESPAEPAASG